MNPDGFAGQESPGGNVNSPWESRAAFERRCIPAEPLRSSLRFGRKTPGIPPSRALSAGRLTTLGAHATLPQAVKKKDWIPFVSLGIVQAALMLGIAAFGFAHLDARMDRLEARMDRIEERLDDLDRRVSRIEGVLMLRADQDLSASAGEPG